MNPVYNPYTPSAGATPPALVGRDKLIEDAKIAVQRMKIGKPNQSIIMVGLRGVGKTALLERIREDIENLESHTVWVESPDSAEFNKVLVAEIRKILINLSRTEMAKDLAQRALAALAGFVKGLKVTHGNFEVALDYPVEMGLADSGILEADFTDLMLSVGNAAKAAGTSVVILIDEIQYMESSYLSVLISALHRCTQKNLPVLLIGAGLPQIRAIAGNLKTYTERMFLYPEITKLNPEDAALAIELPAQSAGESFEKAAVDYIVQQTQGYPYFIQEFGKQVWNLAECSPITLEDARTSTPLVLKALDESFFRVRLDRLTPLEKDYLRAMAETGEEDVRSSTIAETMGRTSHNLAPCRAGLIQKGMVWSPSYGKISYTVPLFGDFMRRVRPLEFKGNE